MRFPVTFFGVNAHLVLEILAYFLAFRFYLYLRKQQTDPISDENRLWIFLAATTGGLVGSRIIGLLEHSEIIESLINSIKEKSFFNVLLLVFSNKTILGGLLFGLFAVEVAKKKLGIRTSSGDLMTYPILLGLFIGRTGCFLEGLEDGTFGLPTALPWGIDFGDGLRRHPTQLYEMLFALFIAAAIAYMEHQKRPFIQKNGRKFQFFLFSYFLFRFFIEFLKPTETYVAGMGAIQLAALVGILYYIALFTKELSEQ